MATRRKNLLDSSFDLRTLPSISLKVSFLNQEAARVTRVTDEIRTFYRGEILITESDVFGEMHIDRTLTFTGEDNDLVNEAYNKFNKVINRR